MDYLTIIKNEMQINTDITFDENSTCWNRMHAHYKQPFRICKFHPANSYKALLDLLHEIGHIRSGSVHNRALDETNATKWAINKLKELGLPIKRNAMQPYKDYIAMTYRRGLRRGLKRKIKSKLYL